MIRHPVRSGRSLLLAALVLALGVLSVGASAGDGGGVQIPLPPTTSPPPPQEPPPHPPVNPQKCMDDYLRNIARCQTACCFDLFWLWPINCNEQCLQDCYFNANTTYRACIHAGSVT